MVFLLYGDRDFLNIVTGVLLRDKFASYMLILSLYYVLQTSLDLIKENVFIL